MLKLIRFIKNLMHLDSCLKENEKQQRENGYRIEFLQKGPERYIKYHEDDREILVHAEFTILNDVILYVNSLKKWDKPCGEELTEFDYRRVFNRMLSYFSCWGDVVLSDALVQDSNDIRESLLEAGIPFEEYEDGIIKYTSTVEEERKRKGGFFNR